MDRHARPRPARDGPDPARRCRPRARRRRPRRQGAGWCARSRPRQRRAAAAFPGSPAARAQRASQAAHAGSHISKNRCVSNFGVDVSEHLHRRLGPSLCLLDLGCDDCVPGVGVGGAWAHACGLCVCRAAAFRSPRRSATVARMAGAPEPCRWLPSAVATLGLGRGLGLLQPARGKGHPRAQRGRGGRPARLAEQAGPVVRGPHDAARRVESPQVNQPGRQEQVRVAPADTWLLIGRQPDGVGGEGQRFAHPAGIPEDHGAADERSDHDVYGFLFRRGQDGLR